MRREDNMHTALVILPIWFIGYILSIYPIYNALVKQHINYLDDRNYGEVKNFQQGDISNSMVGASFLAILWFLAIPYMTSHFIYKRRKPSLETEVDEQIEDYKHRALLKSQMAKARKEIEASYTNDDVDTAAIKRLRNPSHWD